MTDLERGPSTEQSPSMRVESLLNKSPDPHSIVERLRFDATRCEIQFSKGVAANIDEAATIISELQARVSGLEVDLGNANYSNHLIDEEMGEWKSRALAAESSVAELQAERGSWRETFRKQNENFLHVTRLKDEYRQRALAPESEVSALKHDIERHLGIIAEQESSLSRIKEETIEACADEANGVDLEILEGKSELFVSIYCGSRVDASAAIRSLSTDDSKKTAESNHSPSTLNAETE